MSPREELILELRGEIANLRSARRELTAFFKDGALEAKTFAASLKSRGLTTGVGISAAAALATGVRRLGEGMAWSAQTAIDFNAGLDTTTLQFETLMRDAG